jgi:outer membrane lipoprotein-sorting protein
LTSIAVTTLPTKTTYAYGTALDATGLVVIGSYSDGSIVSLDHSKLTFSGHDSQKAGEQEILVSIGDKTATFKVTVYPADPAVVLTSIAVTKLPAKTTYAYGTELDPTGLVVTGRYSDGSTVALDHATLTFSGYKATEAGYQTVLVSIEDKTTNFGVSVEREVITEQLAVTIGLPSGHTVPIFNVPTGGIKLSLNGNKDLPKELVISTSGYSGVSWKIDGNNFSYNNIITIKAQNYTFKDHFITFTGTKDGVQYSETIKFSVEL